MFWIDCFWLNIRDKIKIRNGDRAEMLLGQPQLLKDLNSDIVRDLIYKSGPISKPEIAEQTALKSSYSYQTGKYSFERRMDSGNRMRSGEGLAEKR